MEVASKPLQIALKCLNLIFSFNKMAVSPPLVALICLKQLYPRSVKWELELKWVSDKKKMSALVSLTKFRNICLLLLPINEFTLNATKLLILAILVYESGNYFVLIFDQ